MRILFGIVLMLLVFGCASVDVPSNETQETPESNETMEEIPPVTASDLAQHNSAEDCWILYEGKIYDVTAYLPNHPGDNIAIIESCGKSDTSFEDAFHAQHNKSKVEILESEGVLIGKLEE